MATRDSLPDITKKANAAFSHRWRVISNSRITSLFFVSITGLFVHTSTPLAYLCFRYVDYENMESVEDLWQCINVRYKLTIDL